jgi:hypothetical protein
MDRPKLEVADVFRRYGEAYREQHGASMSIGQRRVMNAIEVCRTAVLGGHLERCDQCDHERNAFNSYHAHFGVKLFHHHLVERGICKSQPVQEAPFAPALVTAFCDWFRTHRGVKEPTLRHYARGATDLIGHSARMSASGMRRPFETFFWNRPARVGRRPRRS